MPKFVDHLAKNLDECLEKAHPAQVVGENEEWFPGASLSAGVRRLRPAQDLVVRGGDE
jgi:hypothetical protein